MAKQISIGEFSMDVPHEMDENHVKIGIHGENFYSSTNIPVDKLPELRDFIDKMISNDQNKVSITNITSCKTCTSFNGGKCRTAGDVSGNHELLVPETHTCSHHSDLRINTDDISNEDVQTKNIPDVVLQSTLDAICDNIKTEVSHTKDITDGHRSAISMVISEIETPINRAYKICEIVDVADDKKMKHVLDLLVTMDNYITNN